MDKIYPYMVEKGLPLITHCSPGSVNHKGMRNEDAQRLADPEYYQVVMNEFPELKICLSHFGGMAEWQRYLRRDKSIEHPTWLEKIVDMMKGGDYPNLYADVSYTVFNFQENIALLKVLMEDKKIRSKVLFGSDFYMTTNERYPERRLSIDLRAALGEELFWKIANTNPRNFLQMVG
jgi:predicted TIM-barrel fold metal-dependent hydrolase